MYCIIVQYIIADLGWNYQCSVLLVICEGNTQVAGGFPLETASKKIFLYHDVTMVLSVLQVTLAFV